MYQKISHTACLIIAFTFCITTDTPNKLRGKSLPSVLFMKQTRVHLENTDLVVYITFSLMCDCTWVRMDLKDPKRRLPRLVNKAVIARVSPHHSSAFSSHLLNPLYLL